MMALEIRKYRWGYFQYVERQPYGAQLEQIKPRVAKLVALTSRYHRQAVYSGMKRDLGKVREYLAQAHL